MKFCNLLNVFTHHGDVKSASLESESRAFFKSRDRNCQRLWKVLKQIHASELETLQVFFFEMVNLHQILNFFPIHYNTAKVPSVT